MPGKRSAFRILLKVQFSSIQSLNHVRFFATPWTIARQACLSLTNSRSLLKLVSTESVMPSTVIPFSSHAQSFPASGSYQMSQLFASGSQSVEVSISTSVIPMNIQDWFPLGNPRDSQESSPTPQFKSSVLRCSAFFTVQLSHPYTTTGKTIALIRRTFVGKVMSLLLNMLCRLIIIFLPMSKSLLISWLQSPSAVILEPPKIKSATVSTVSPSICHEVMGPDAMIFVFWMFSFKPAFSTLLFHFHQEAL